MARHTFRTSTSGSDPRPASVRSDGACSLLRSLRPPVDEEPVRLRRPDLRRAAAATPRRSRTPSAAFVVFCAAVGRRLPHQRHPRSRGRSAASGEVAPADRVGRRLAVGGAIGGGAVDRRRGARRPRSGCRPIFGVVAHVVPRAAGAVLGLAQAHRDSRRADDRRSASSCARSAAPWRSTCDQPLAAAAMLLLALFLALSKRRAELVLLADDADRPSAEPGGVQPVSARPDDRRRHGVDAAGLRVLHDEPGDRAEVRDGSAALDGAVSALRDLPVPLSGAPARGRREPVGNAADGSAAARSAWRSGARRCLRSSTVPGARSQPDTMPTIQSRDSPHQPRRRCWRTTTS